MPSCSEASYFLRFVMAMPLLEPPRYYATGSGKTPLEDWTMMPFEHLTQHSNKRPRPSSDIRFLMTSAKWATSVELSDRVSAVTMLSLPEMSCSPMKVQSTSSVIVRSARRFPFNGGGVSCYISALAHWLWERASPRDRPITYFDEGNGNIPASFTESLTIITAAET